MISYRHIKMVVFFLLLSILSNAQSTSISKVYIPYRLNYSIDSLLTIVLDSMNNVALEGLSIDRFASFCRLEWLTENIVLRHYPDLKTDTLQYLAYLTRNTNRFYLSYNKKYRIPITFGLLDIMFKYDYNKYPSREKDQTGIIIAIIQNNMERRIQNFYCKIPKWALKLEYQDNPRNP